MKNYEKYADEIRKIKSDIGIEWCELFAKPKVLKSLGRKCEDVSCGLCSALAMLWLLEEYEEPETDWSKVEVDTPILVRADEAIPWARRYFAKYEDGIVYVWNLDEQAGLQITTKICLLGHMPNWQKVRKSDGSKRICNEKSIG